jgi:hypothetical protein
MINLRSQYAQDIIFGQFCRFSIIIEAVIRFIFRSLSKNYPQSYYCIINLGLFQISRTSEPFQLYRTNTHRTCFNRTVTKYFLNNRI